MIHRVNTHTGARVAAQPADSSGAVGYAPAVRLILGTVRWWLPIVGAFVLLGASNAVPPFIAYLFIVGAAALVFEVGTALLAGANRSGGLPDHRQ